MIALSAAVVAGIVAYLLGWVGGHRAGHRAGYEAGFTEAAGLKREVQAKDLAASMAANPTAWMRHFRKGNWR